MDQKNGAPHFFNPKDIGESLREVSSDVIRTESQNVKSRWLHSDRDADLFIWHDEKGNIIKQQLTFCGQVVEWNLIDGVKTGLVLEDERGELRKASEVLKFDKAPQLASVRMACDVIEHVVSLAEAERKILKLNMNESPRLSSMDPAEFVKLFGPSPEKGHRSYFFAWCIRLLKRLFR